VEDLNIRVAVVSDDPFFLLAVRALLGRDRHTRIISTAATLSELEAARTAMAGHVDVIVCDIDALVQREEFFDELRRFVSGLAAGRVMGLARGSLEHVVLRTDDIPMAALLCKAELGFCLHLAVRAISQYDVVLITERVKPLLERGSYLHTHAHTLGPHRPHPDLSARREEVAMLRVFVGLDNPDISDELSLSEGVVREYISDIYTALGADGELDVFEALSEWWWTTRFLQALV